MAPTAVDHRQNAFPMSRLRIHKMNKDTRSIMQLLGVDEHTALKIQNKMGENRLDFSECNQREFNLAARTAYRQIFQLRPE